MMLVDANVLLDVVLDRHPHVEHSAALFDRLRSDSRSGFVAWHTLSTIYYIANKEVGDAVARDFIGEVVKVLDVALINHDSIQIALNLPLSDFEDAMQVASALACGANHIVSRDQSDFDDSPIPALEPEAALEKLF